MMRSLAEPIFNFYKRKINKSIFLCFYVTQTLLEQPAADVLGAARVVALVTDALFWPILECAAADMLL
jgi:hypothetical protein